MRGQKALCWWETLKSGSMQNPHPDWFYLFCIQWPLSYLLLVWFTCTHTQVTILSAQWCGHSLSSSVLDLLESLAPWLDWLGHHVKRPEPHSGSRTGSTLCDFMRIWGLDSGPIWHLIQERIGSPLGPGPVLHPGQTRAISGPDQGHLWARSGPSLGQIRAISGPRSCATPRPDQGHLWARSGPSLGP